MSSVPVERRNTGELNVNTEARRMCAYTLKITANPKTFDTAHKDMIDMIRADAIEICTLAKRGERTRERVDASYQAWRQHASRGNNWKLLQRMDKYYINLWKGVDENEDHETGTVPGAASGA